MAGPEGSGKSALFQLIAGLETPTEGDIYIGGVVVNQLFPQQRDIAMVLPNHVLYPELTVKENLAFRLKMHRMPEAEVNSMCRRLPACCKSIRCWTESRARLLPCNSRW